MPKSRIGLIGKGIKKLKKKFGADTYPSTHSLAQSWKKEWEVNRVFRKREVKKSRETRGERRKGKENKRIGMGRQKKGRGSQGELLKWLHRRREGNDEKIFLTLLSPGIQNSSVYPTNNPPILQVLHNT